MEFSEPINVVWFKRDLRLQDHEPLHKAINMDLPVLLIFMLEPSVRNAPDWSIRHWQFAYYSVLDLNQQLEKYQTKIHILSGEASDIFEYLAENYQVQNVFSYQETGNHITYQRDLQLQTFFEQKSIEWTEYQSNGVIRGLQNRRTWNQAWHDKMNAPVVQPILENIKNVSFELPIPFFMELMTSRQLSNYSKSFQPAGETSAHKYVDSFIKRRSKGYLGNISKPQNSQKNCSRLSPYLAWGNLSIRQVYQVLRKKSERKPLSKDLSAFKSRLHWHCHFIQKFETEERIEFENLNRAYDNLLHQPINNKYIQAWKTGETGFPLVDASMKCVQKTGYLNFRMRAMLVSFLTHILWQPWQAGVHHLAQLFLDYEIGIHVPQFQMQAGITGINTVRVYNPIKQSQTHDTEGIFIKKWLPTLQHIPNKLIHKPFEMTELEQQFYHCRIGKDYPKPIVNFKVTYQNATKVLWELKKHETVKAENKEILKRHVSSSPSRRDF